MTSIIKSKYDSQILEENMSLPSDSVVEEKNDTVINKKRKKTSIQIDFNYIDWENVLQSLFDDIDDVGVHHQLTFNFRGRHDKMASLFIYKSSTRKDMVSKSVGGSSLYLECGLANLTEFEYIADAVYPHMAGGSLVPFAYSSYGIYQEEKMKKYVNPVKDDILNTCNESDSILLHLFKDFIEQTKILEHQWNKWTIGNCQ